MYFVHNFKNKQNLSNMLRYEDLVLDQIRVGKIFLSLIKQLDRGLLLDAGPTRTPNYQLNLGYSTSLYLIWWEEHCNILGFTEGLLRKPLPDNENAFIINSFEANMNLDGVTPFV